MGTTSSGRRPSMADVAALAGVSHQTVSRVLNGSPLVRADTRERIEAAIRELGYRRNNAARQLATARSGRIGMLAAHLALHGPSMISAAVQEAGRAAGYEVSLIGMIELSQSSLRDAVDRLLDEDVEAIVVAVAHQEAQAIVESLSLPIPVVLVQGVAPGTPMAAGMDQVAGAATATGHLLDLGHRSVAHVSGPLDWVESGRRREGWRRAHEDRGLLPGPEIEGDWSAASGYEAGLRVCRSADVTAVFAANDSMALGLLKALHEHGRRVPEDVSVVGFDNLPEAEYFWPPLTTVNQEFSALGRRALDLAIRALGGEESPVADLLTPDLVVRRSAAAPPA